jgi:hypothetical protein
VHGTTALQGLRSDCADAQAPAHVAAGCISLDSSATPSSQPSLAQLLCALNVKVAEMRMLSCLLQGGEDEDEGSSPQDLWAPSVLSRITDIACSL